MNSGISRVCFVGIYGQPQDEILREGFADRDITLVEATVTNRSFSEAISDRRLPIQTMKATMNYFQRFPAWAFPLLVAVAFIVHAVATWSMILLKFRDVRRADVLVVPHMGDTSVLLAKPLSVVLGTPLIYFSHNGLYFPLIENQTIFKSGSVAAQFVYFIDRLDHSLADRVIVFSEASKRRFADFYGLSDERYEVIYISVNESNFDKTPAAKQNRSVNVLYWGNFHSHHGTRGMVKAADMLPQYRFAFLGQSEKRDEVVELASSLEVENIKFPGFVSLECLTEYIHSADVVLGPVADNPQTEFTIGTKVAEAAYMEKAIVVARQPATRETFTHLENAYLIEPGNPTDLAEAIRTIISDRGLREHLEQGAFEVYQRHFSSNRPTERFLDVVDECH
jgi:glycosyltransferase involved in cell wall biosynthesis